MDDELKAALERAHDHKPTPQEMFLQKVSFVYGQQDYDGPNPRSKREVAEAVAEQHGYPPEWAELIPMGGR
jgi:hypothetical protein